MGTLTNPEVDNVGPYSDGWGCDACGKFFQPTEACYRNRADEFDMCTKCHEKASMFILSFTARKFWRPKEGEEAITVENIQRLLDNHKAGSLTESKLEL